MSFGSPEFKAETGLDGTFTTPAGHNGVTFVAASGDGGSPGDYPAYSPNVLAVGGTTLSLDRRGNYAHERGWRGSGGGESRFESRPGFQAAFNLGATARGIPDVAFDADPGSGAAVYDTYHERGWIRVGGTSFAAPAWAALLAIADQGRTLSHEGTLANAQDVLYGLPSSDFHDIQVGRNGHFVAHRGYDLVTGLGSPVANLLVADLVNVVSRTAAPQGDSGRSITGDLSVAPAAAGETLPSLTVDASDFRAIMDPRPNTGAASPSTQFAHTAARSSTVAARLANQTTPARVSARTELTPRVASSGSASSPLLADPLAAGDVGSLTLRDEVRSANAGREFQWVADPATAKAAAALPLEGLEAIFADSPGSGPVDKAGLLPGVVPSGNEFDPLLAIVLGGHWRALAERATARGQQRADW
jgi:hypothetical protein